MKEFYANPNDREMISYVRGVRVSYNYRSFCSLFEPPVVNIMHIELTWRGGVDNLTVSEFLCPEGT